MFSSPCTWRLCRLESKKKKKKEKKRDTGGGAPQCRNPHPRWVGSQTFCAFRKSAQCFGKTCARLAAWLLDNCLTTLSDGSSAAANTLWNWKHKQHQSADDYQPPGSRPDTCDVGLNPDSDGDLSVMITWNKKHSPLTCLWAEGRGRRTDPDARLTLRLLSYFSLKRDLFCVIRFTRKWIKRIKLSS